MPKPAASEQEFIELFRTHGAAGTARALGVSVRAVLNRRNRLERMLNVVIAQTGIRRASGSFSFVPSQIEGRRHFEVKNGVVMVGSDAHYWPGEISTAHRAFVKFCKELKPSVVIMNGDILDGAAISRFPTNSWSDWESRPSIAQEIQACQERLDEIRSALNKNTALVWPLGNHDARLEQRIANHAPEFAHVHGVHLKDHFPEWIPCWSAWINGTVVVKHRIKSGVHATHNSTKDAGLSTVTGHLHSLKVTPWTDYNGTRFGVDCGCMAETFSPCFQHYMEDSPRNWRSGFVVLTFHNGRLLWPEVVHVVDAEHVEFRGQVFEV